MIPNVNRVVLAVMAVMPLLAVLHLYGQANRVRPTALPQTSAQLEQFKRIVAKAGANFVKPGNFIEIKALDNDDFTFDYAMKLPSGDFEVWYQVRSQKENWASYRRALADDKLRLDNPDSVYSKAANANAIALSGERNSFVRILPADVLKRNNADAGKSYMLNLLDRPETGHYRYALLISLQKYHTGTMMMVCFTNNRGPQFFKDVERATAALKFLPPPR